MNPRIVCALGLTADWRMPGYIHAAIVHRYFRSNCVWATTLANILQSTVTEHKSSVNLAFYNNKKSKPFSQLAKPTQHRQRSITVHTLHNSPLSIKAGHWHIMHSHSLIDNVFSSLWGYNSVSTVSVNGQVENDSDGLLLTCLARLFFFCPKAKWPLILRLGVGGRCWWLWDVALERQTREKKDAVGAVKCCYFSCYYAPCCSTGLCLYDISYAAGVKVHRQTTSWGERQEGKEGWRTRGKFFLFFCIDQTEGVHAVPEGGVATGSRHCAPVDIVGLCSVLQMCRYRSSLLWVATEQNYITWKKRKFIFSLSYAVLFFSVVLVFLFLCVVFFSGPLLWARILRCFRAGLFKVWRYEPGDIMI